MKEKGWIVMERLTPNDSWDARVRNFAPTKKEAIAAYERTTGSYQERTGVYKLDEKGGIAKVVRAEFHIGLEGEDE